MGISAKITTFADKRIKQYNMRRVLLWAIALCISVNGEARSVVKNFKVEDGNYRVTAVLGSKKSAGDTWVRAESRRLCFENIHTKKGEFKTITFTVNKRSPYINEKMRIKLKEREKDYENWDDMLTIDFCGDNPQVKDVQIEKIDDAVTMFLCGNSTVTDQNKEPWASWGQMIPRWFDDKVSVANFAESGERTTSFISSNRWAAVMQRAKKGDYILIEFGHNDEKDKGPGSGAWYNFTYNLKRMIDEARQKECQVVLVTPTARRMFKNGKNQNTHGDYPAAAKAVAERENVPIIDLTTMSTILYETMGEEGSKRLLVHYPANTFPNQEKALADNTHFNTFGAYEIAKCIVEGLKQLALPITNHIVGEWQGFVPSQPDDWQKWSWPMSEFEQQKPDGN